MPGVADMNVKIGADISDVLSKVDAAKAKLNQLIETQAQLKDEINNLNASIKENNNEYRNLNSQLNTVNGGLRKTKEQSSLLRRELANLDPSNKAGAFQLNKKLEQLAVQEKIATTEANKLRAALDGTRNSTSELQKDVLRTKIALKETTSAVSAQTVVVKNAENAGLGFARGATKIYSGLRKLAYIIPGLGIAGLISLISGPLIDAFSDWYDSIDKVSEAQKRLKANLENYNEINKAADKDAGKRITALKILYDASTSVNLSMKERLAAVKALQKDFPEYFKNISKETILNGGAKSSYDALTESILKSSRAKAAISRLDEIAAKQLDNDIQRQKIRNAADNQISQIYKNGPKQLSGGSSSSLGTGTGSAVTISIQEQIAAVNKLKNAALEQIGANDKLLQSQVDFIKQFVGLSELAKEAAKEIKPPKVEKVKKHIETIADVLKKIAIQIDFLNQKELLLHTSQAKAKIDAIESGVDHLMQKFKLLSDNPIILKLQAQAADIELKDIIKKQQLDFRKQFQDKTFKSGIPVDLFPKPEIKFPPGTFDEQILRDQLLERLKELGIKVTVPVSIGYDIVGNPIIVGSEKVTSNASILKLEQTLKTAEKRIKDFKENATQIFDDIGTSLSSSFGEGLGNVLSGGGDSFKGLFDSIFNSLGQQIQSLGALMIKSGIEIKLAKDAFKKLLADPVLAIGVGIGLVALGSLIKSSIGKSAPGFSTGGPVWGAGSATSDSIPARLSKGEYVIKAAKVQEFGLDFFNKINFGSANIKDILRDKFGMMKFATGGFVSPNAVNLTRPITVPNISIGGGQLLEITGDFQLRNDRLVAAVKRGSAQIGRNS